MTQNLQFTAPADGDDPPASVPASGSADAPAAVLGLARGARNIEQVAAVQVALAALTWANLHPAGELGDAAIYVAGEAEVALAGEGAPEVAEFCVAEFGAAIGRTTAAARGLIGDVLELAYRLPLTWQAVIDGELAVWRARRVAGATKDLSIPAAAYVDTHLADAGRRRGSEAVMERLVAEAVARFDPDAAELEQEQAQQTCRVDVETDQVMLDGLCHFSGLLDAADALDLDRALALIARDLRSAQAAGPGLSELSLDIRRSMALGVLARSYLSHPDSLSPGGEVGRADRRVVLYLHLNQAAPGTADTATGVEDRLAWCENTRSSVLATQVQRWCGTAGRITVKPVIDLHRAERSDGYLIPDGMREAVILRDHTCVFPWCNHPARTADIDHIVPYNHSDAQHGGPTSTANLAALCRHHHRLKTHSGWDYVMTSPGVYQWTSPLGQTFVRDHSTTQPHSNP
ncbi:MAG: HNH endonuclease signature motif containing protein [Beutenbergiaceae bacterium]